MDTPVPSAHTAVRSSGNPSLENSPGRLRQRQELAQLIGRLLARHWLSQRRSGQATPFDVASDT